MAARLLVLDFDNGILPLSQALNLWCDCAHVIGTTKSHQMGKDGAPPCDRFRVVLRFEQPITDLDDYRATMRFYIEKYGADKACVDGARYFWPCREIISIADDGYEQTTYRAPPSQAPKSYAEYRAARFIPPWVEGYLRFGCPEGTRNSNCFKIGIYLTKCGYREDEIVDLILRSPITLGADEVREAVCNGATRGRKEIDDEVKGENTSGGDRSGPLCAAEREGGPET